MFALFCECGELGCWPFVAHLEQTDTTVTWQKFHQPHRPERDYSGFGPFIFDRVHYEEAVASVAPLWGETEG